MGNYHPRYMSIQIQNSAYRQEQYESAARKGGAFSWYNPINYYMIFKNSVLLAFFSVLSLLLAIVRDRLLAMYVGVGPALDVYNASFRIQILCTGHCLLLLHQELLFRTLQKKLVLDISLIRAQS